MDAVIFVFSLENEASFSAVYNYYTKMSHFRNSAEIPIILVGTQGKQTQKIFNRNEFRGIDRWFSITKHQKIKRFYFVSDAISDRSPRVIDDARARKLASDLKRCSYYETCATYGLNVERVFQDGKIYIY